MRYTLAALILFTTPAMAHDWFVGKHDPVTGGSCCTTAESAGWGDCEILDVEKGVLTGDEHGIGYRLRLTAEQASKINPARTTPVDTIIPFERIQESPYGDYRLCIPATRLESMQFDFYCFWAPPNT